jgi:hypothetical protein
MSRRLTVISAPSVQILAGPTAQQASTRQSAAAQVRALRSPGGAFGQGRGGLEDLASVMRGDCRPSGSMSRRDMQFSICLMGSKARRLDGGLQVVCDGGLQGVGLMGFRRSARFGAILFDTHVESDE